MNSNFSRDKGTFLSQGSICFARSPSGVRDKSSATAPMAVSDERLLSMEILLGGSMSLFRKSPVPSSKPRNINPSRVWSKAHLLISGSP